MVLYLFLDLKLIILVCILRFRFVIGFTQYITTLRCMQTCSLAQSAIRPGEKNTVAVQIQNKSVIYKLEKSHLKGPTITRSQPWVCVACVAVDSQRGCKRG